MKHIGPPLEKLPGRSPSAVNYAIWNDEQYTAEIPNSPLELVILRKTVKSISLRWGGGLFDYEEYRCIIEQIACEYPSLLYS